jgi:hypothetical protein
VTAERAVHKNVIDELAGLVLRLRQGQAHVDHLFAGSAKDLVVRQVHRQIRRGRNAAKAGHGAGRIAAQRTAHVAGDGVGLQTSSAAGPSLVDNAADRQDFSRPRCRKKKAG